MSNESSEVVKVKAGGREVILDPVMDITWDLDMVRDLVSEHGYELHTVYVIQACENSSTEVHYVLVQPTVQVMSIKSEEGLPLPT